MMRLEMVIGMVAGIVNGLLIFITLITHFTRTCRGTHTQAHMYD